MSELIKRLVRAWLKWRDYPSQDYCDGLESICDAEETRQEIADDFGFSYSGRALLYHPCEKCNNTGYQFSTEVMDVEPCYQCGAGGIDLYTPPPCRDIGIPF